MDSVEAFRDLLLLSGIAFGLLMLVFYIRYKIKSLFIGFRKLKTEADIAELSERSKVFRYLFTKWNNAAKSKQQAHPLEKFLAACGSGNVNDLKRLISSGVKVNATRRRGGKTGLMLASQSGRIDAVRFLLKKGADSNIAGGGSGKTALIRASEKGDIDVAKLLLGYGAEVDSTSRVSGKTALMGAVENGNLEMAHFLIEAGADVNAKNKYGETAADIAYKKGLDRLLALLRACGADFSKYSGKAHETPVTSDIDKYYAVLRCTKSDNIDQIKAKYRVLVKEYHPDVIQGKGLPADFVEFANKKFQMIREAYQHIVQQHDTD